MVGCLVRRILLISLFVFLSLGFTNGVVLADDAEQVSCSDYLDVLSVILRSADIATRFGEYEVYRVNSPATLSLNMVSSGIVLTYDINSPDGVMRVDAVIAYSLNQTGDVVETPVAFAVTYPDAEVALFMSPFSNEQGIDAYSSVKRSLAPGTPISVSLSGFVDTNDVIWSECANDASYLYGERACNVGVTIDNLYPDGDKSVLAGERPPLGFVLFGWTINELDTGSVDLPICSPTVGLVQYSEALSGASK